MIVDREVPLEISGLSKRFGSRQALADIDLVVRRGEVHALIGQNGCGKSTLVKSLAGYHAPDRGSISLGGHELRLPVSGYQLRTAGVSIVHQDLGLLGDLTVMENVGIGNLARSRFSRRVDWKAEERRTHEVMGRLNASISPRALVSGLGPLERSIVAIARALTSQKRGEGVIVLDEATRALPRDALVDFHRMLRTMVDAGGSVLLVSHNLEEVLEHADRVTVLRDGRVAGAGLETTGLAERDLAALMLGREVDEVTRAAETPRPLGPPITVEGLRGKLVADATFAVRPGEVLGITGIAGAGWEEVPYLLSGAFKARGGTLSMTDRKPLSLPRASLRDCLRHGISLLPERRMDEGLAGSMGVLDNLTLPRVATKGRPWFIGRRWQSEEFELLRTLDIRPLDTDLPVGKLSGGNQQKVLLGKWLAGSPRLLLLHEPTQAVDVGARTDILNAVRDAAARGVAVVVASIHPADLAAVCDRVLVMSDGVVVDDVAQPTEQVLLERIYTA